MLNIIKYPDEILRKKSHKIKPAEFNSAELKKFGEEMFALMKKADGLGLAAPQVAKHWRIVAINTKSGDQIFINPRIYWKSFFKKEMGEEGCLSLPQTFGQVRRHKKIWISFYNIEGKKLKLFAEGLLARVFQHEIDHLNGVLFIDRATAITKGDEKLKNINL